MHAVRAALNRDEALLEQVLRLIGEVGSHPCLHGVVLDLNPLWINRRLAYWPDWDPDEDDELIFNLLGLPPNWPPKRVALDFGGEIANKALLSGETRHPFMLKVSASRHAQRPYASDDKRGLDELQRVFMDWPIPATLAVRSAPRLLYRATIKCRTGTGAAGTVGGFLHDRYSRQTFAATCGHVLPAGEMRAAGFRLAPCAHAAVPRMLPRGEACCAECAHAVELDFALAPVLSGDIPPQPVLIARRIRSRQSVTCNAASGKRRYVIGGVGMMHLIGGVCWEGLVELRQPTNSGVLHPAIRALFRRPPRGGDSGSWIVTDADEWAGVVVAGDFEMGYALEADSTVAKANAAFHTDLVLPT